MSSAEFSMTAISMHSENVAVYEHLIHI